MCRLITLFLESTPPLLEQMRAAVESGDHDALAGAAHTLKGSLVQFSEQPARALTMELERTASSGDWTNVPALVAGLEVEIARFSAALRPFVSADEGLRKSYSAIG